MKIAIAPAVRLPLFLTRQVLYGLVLFTAFFVVLLPVSVVTYLNFYKMLIPSERILVATDFVNPGSEVLEYARATRVEPREFLPLVQPDLDYLIRLNLQAICRFEKQFHVLPYHFKIDLVTVSDELIVNCDLRYIYVEKNKWVPYNLRYWVPPALVDIFKTVKVDWPVIYLTGAEIIKQVQQAAPVFEFENPLPLILDSRHTTIDFVVEWDGIRYYMSNYYLTSFVLGAGGFWILTSWICLLTSLAFLGYIVATDEEDLKVKKER